MSVPKPVKADYLAMLTEADVAVPPDATKADIIGLAKSHGVKVKLGDAERVAKTRVSKKPKGPVVTDHIFTKEMIEKAQEKSLEKSIHETREAWLRAAYDALLEQFGWAFDAEEDFDHKPFDVQISTGFPRQDRNGKVIGQCWKEESGNGSRNIFISPVLVDPSKVLATLLHEMIHAQDDCKNQHKGAFRRTWKAVGFVGKATVSEPGPELADTLKTISGALGWYPHTVMTPAKKEKTQTTRMLKIECPTCGYIVRTTKKWIAEGVPTCPCGTEMEAEDNE